VIVRLLEDERRGAVELKKSKKRSSPKKTATATPSTQRLFKVLVDGRSCHGGDMQWSLPTAKPGAWHEVDGPLKMCERGIHLTTDPARWWRPGCEVFECEAEGVEGDGSIDDRKVVVRRARLVRRLSDSDLVDLRILRFGHHEIRKGLVIVERSASVTAYGSASIRASGSASVTAYGSASVTAYGSASVTAYGSASVTAYDSASVTASDSASVTAYGSASVRASGSASVTASGSASVTASGSASVTAYGSASVTAEHEVTIVARWGSGTFQLKDRAVLIDRRGDGAPKVVVVS
jgi:hypothetical protein